MHIYRYLRTVRARTGTRICCPGNKSRRTESECDCWNTYFSNLVKYGSFLRHVEFVNIIWHEHGIIVVRIEQSYLDSREWVAKTEAHNLFLLSHRRSDNELSFANGLVCRYTRARIMETNIKKIRVKKKTANAYLTSVTLAVTEGTFSLAYTRIESVDLCSRSNFA